MFALLAGAAMVFTSCDKEVDSTDLKVDLARKAQFKAYVYAQLDRTKAGFEFAPEGTIVILSVNYADFGTQSNGKWVDTVTVDVNGTISAEVPVDDDGVTLRIEPIIFEANQVRPYGSNSNTVKLIFKAPVQNVALSTSTNAVEQIFYNTTLLASEVEFATLNFSVIAETDNSNLDTEAIANVEVTLYNDQWMQKFVTDGSGKFIAAVPANENIYVDVKTVIGKRVPNQDDPTIYDTKNYIYKIEGGLLGAFSSSQDFTLDLGDGIEE